MEHFMIGPVEEAFGKSITAYIPAPDSNNDFLWGVLVTLMAGGIAYLIIHKNKL